ncbi:hypothetical protein HYPBUDRAFT_152306 [Hyphopichia burtonii NRRL Y-1933]|uniref:RING-type domain-containing protein n=1 Tax=Hyphopichia burtonii NRRL Y-1933 TaxID=984485 RepID=A0A1E4RPX8_9ASCO|nr:hypothetical protein HYPBUDRAFT_152306 [Hyphopichia burtonii NRRL Y-1933]ODV69135.1 hypothetical protein HYPBUDRAFT_152306 [Hyphopichia burtonii NRRL Y-1933]
MSKDPNSPSYTNGQTFTLNNRSENYSRANHTVSDRSKGQHIASQKQHQKMKARPKEKSGGSLVSNKKGASPQASNKGSNLGGDELEQYSEPSGIQSKKFGKARKNQISLDHLLDFQSYKDLEVYQQNHNKSKARRNSDHSKKSRSNVSKVHLHGMSFINVNYKFIVDYRDDYKIQQLDPNVPVETSSILRIVVPKGNSCPICLSEEPIAPRMITSCGHILCLTCLLSLLESEIPTSKKRESLVIVEKYRDCPLCASIIRTKEVKPVLIDLVDERFEVPKIHDEAILTLMARPQDKILPLPSALDELSLTIDNFPWVSQSDNLPDLTPYLRLLKADFAYLIAMYEKEKKDIMTAYENEKHLYNDDGKFIKLAIENINKDIEEWSAKFLQQSLAPANKDTQRLHSNPFFYYQTGFRANSTYVLSPLDMKVLKTAYNGDYTRLPSSVIAKIENIRYEDLSPEVVTTKYKYLSHLPLGSSIGFLECNWLNNEYIDQETWKIFKNDLTKRTKASERKLRKEDKNKKLALDAEELRTRIFFERENNPELANNDDYTYDYYPANFGSLTINDYRELPPLSSLANNASSSSQAENTNDDTHSDSSLDQNTFQTTIWGTKIPKSEVQPSLHDDDDDPYDWDPEEMIRRAKEEMEKEQQAQGNSKGKKKKKKLVLLSSNSNW